MDTSYAEPRRVMFTTCNTPQIVAQHHTSPTPVQYTTQHTNLAVTFTTQQFMPFTIMARYESGYRCRSWKRPRSGMPTTGCAVRQRWHSPPERHERTLAAKPGPQRRRWCWLRHELALGTCKREENGARKYCVTDQNADEGDE